jgi:hypothetical protein
VTWSAFDIFSSPSFAEAVSLGFRVLFLADFAVVLELEELDFVWLH